MGGGSYELMGGRVEEHSSHSFGTPLQPMHTSDVLGAYKRRWGLLKRETEQSAAHCQLQALTQIRLVNSGRESLACEDVESLCCWVPLHCAGKDTSSLT